MIGAKAFDPVTGVDIHMIQPPGPVPPVPVPHPFIGMLIDPMDFAPIIGATVMVNGMPRATAGTGGQCIPPHIPIGGVFIKPPANECEVFMGSATVLSDGDPQSFLGMPALSCHDVGMPPPPRPTKKRKTKSLVLPTSVVLAVPAGMPVLIGGPPTISMMALGMRAAMAGLGKAFRKLRKVQKASRKMKALSQKVRKGAKKVMDKLGVPPSAQNKVNRAICKVTGHPVDVATGKVFTESVDFELAGPIPFRWERVWYSCSVYDGPLGRGWHHSYDMALLEEEGTVGIRLADGRPAVFPALEPGQTEFSGLEKATLSRSETGYELRCRDKLRYRFEEGPSGQICRLVEIADHHHRRLQLRYDGQGRLNAVEDGAGRAVRMVYDAEGRLSALHAPDPERPSDSVEVARYEYREGRLVAAYDARGLPERYEYEESLLRRETDRNGYSYHFEYEGSYPEARCVKTRGDGGVLERALFYDAPGLTRVVDSVGGEWSYVANGDGLVIEETDPQGRTRLLEYGDHGEKLAEVSPLGHRRSWAYDERLNCTEVGWPDGSKISIEYGPGDLPVRLETRSGEEWAWRYDDRGRLQERRDPGGQVTRFRYDENGLVEQVDPDGRILRFQYDPWGLLAAISADDRTLMSWRHDVLGRPVLEKDSVGNERRRWFDLSGLPYEIQDEEGTRWRYEYDGLGKVVRARSEGREVELRYDPTGRLASRSEQGETTRFLHDSEGRLTAIRNPSGQVYQYEFDPVGRVIAERRAGGDWIRFDRDEDGRAVVVRHPSGRTTHYTHDECDRIVRVTHSDGSFEQWQYDPAGRLSEVTDGERRVAFVRDAAGRTVLEEAGDHWVRSEYDERGDRIGVSTSFGIEHRIGRSGTGDVTTAELRLEGDGQPAWWARWVRDPLGAEIERLLPGEIACHWERDPLGRPTRRRVTAPGREVEDERYGWEPHGILGWRESEGDRARFDHDPLGRLVRVQRDGSAHLRIPGPAGEIFERLDRSDRTYGRDGQPLAITGSAGRTSYEYDEDGFLAARVEPGGRRWRFGWSASGRLRRVTRPDGVVVEFRYDPLGRRIEKRVGDVVTRWLWDGSTIIHEWKTTETPGSDPSPVSRDEVVTWLFEPGSFVPMARIKGPERWSIITDHLGTPRVALDAQGREVWRGQIGHRGELELRTGRAAELPFRFPGQYHDEETGLTYNGFRYYDPASGHYVSPDPIRMEGGTRLYGYVEDPTTGSDPLGLAKDCGEVVSVYHGSLNDASHIRKNGLDPDKTPTWVTRDRKAAENAVSTNRYEVAMGDAKDPGIIESRIPKDEFDTVMKKSERDYSSGWGDRDSSEIVMRDKEQVETFNKYIVREGE